MKFKLSEKSKSNIRSSTGLKASDISSMDFSEWDEYLENRLKKKLQFTMPSDPRLIGRGSILLFLGRILDIAPINRYFCRL